MTVSLRVTCEVNPIVWATNYGIAPDDRDAIRADVRAMFAAEAETALSDVLRRTGNVGTVNVSDETGPENMPATDPTLAYTVGMEWHTPAIHTVTTDGANWAEAMYFIAHHANVAGLAITDPRPYSRKHEWTLRDDSGRAVGYAIAERDSREAVQ